MKSKPQPRVRKLGRGSRVLALLLLSLLVTGCVISTGVHLLQTRAQVLDFDENCHFEPARGERGPQLQFLDPLLTRDDVRTIANGRFASSIDSVDGEERWIYSWVRHPETIDRPINLELRFRDDRLCALALDPRFSQILGDARIEMLMRSFTSRITDLNLKAREIRCQVPLDSLARFAPLGASELMGCFGRSNYSRNTEIPGNRRHVYRYLLQGTEGDKAKMSFSGYLDFRRDLATAVSARIGSFSLILDFQEERNRAGGGVPATASTGP